MRAEWAVSRLAYDSGEAPVAKWAERRGPSGRSDAPQLPRSGATMVPTREAAASSRRCSGPAGPLGRPGREFLVDLTGVALPGFLQVEGVDHALITLRRRGSHVFGRGVSPLTGPGDHRTLSSPYRREVRARWPDERRSRSTMSRATNPTNGELVNVRLPDHPASTPRCLPRAGGLR